MTITNSGMTSAAHDTGMMEGPQGFDQSSGLWEARGWRQVDALRRKLEKLQELRELVRSLGRAGGRGPRRRAPEEVIHVPTASLVLLLVGIGRSVQSLASLVKQHAMREQAAIWAKAYGPRMGGQGSRLPSS